VPQEGKKQKQNAVGIVPFGGRYIPFSGVTVDEIDRRALTRTEVPDSTKISASDTWFLALSWHGRGASIYPRVALGQKILGNLAHFDVVNSQENAFFNRFEARKSSKVPKAKSAITCYAGRRNALKPCVLLGTREWLEVF
jgi:hypothetical protein